MGAAVVFLIGAVIFYFAVKLLHIIMQLRYKSSQKYIEDFCKNQREEYNQKAAQLVIAQDKLNEEYNQKAAQLIIEQDKLNHDKNSWEGQKNSEKRQLKKELEAQRKAWEADFAIAKDALNKQLDVEKKKLAAYQERCEALDRQIHGYGDEYLIPTWKLIDELAANHDVHQAGNKLKETRQSMRQMIKQNTAVILQGGAHEIGQMILDIFNTKVEDLLVRVNHENSGKLKKELSDIYALCKYYIAKNQLRVEINPQYYEIRQKELEWAGIVHALRVAEREEQRAIREREREEERARKEYERAIRDAQKEEAMLQQAMEKARAAYAAANEEQRSKYEQQLADLEIKLREAEEKNQRALSMAQQTKAGHVYIISNIGSFGENMLKIGMTRRLEPLDRVRELGDASVPFLFDVHAIIYSEDAPKLEKQLHHELRHLRVNKVNPRKEFFRISAGQLKEKLSDLGISVHFTLAAEAAEYRETLRIESMETGEQDRLLDDLLKAEHEDD